MDKKLVTLPNGVADYLESMREKNYTLLGAFAGTNATVKEKELMTKFFGTIDNQEKFALAWINGYKREEKFYTVKFKNFDEDGVYGYLNYNKKKGNFTLSSNKETTVYQAEFTKEFLEKNDFGWVFGCEGIKLEEVK